MSSIVVIDATKYPFAVKLEEFLKSRYGVEDLIIVLERRRELIQLAVDRLREAISRVRIELKHVVRDDTQILSFYTALLLTRLSGDKWLISRHALAEAERAARLLEKESPHVIEVIGKLVGLRTLRYHLRNPLRDPMGVKGATMLYKLYEFSLHFTEYVIAARRLLGDPSWKTVNMPVYLGRVFLERRHVIRILKESIMNYIESAIISDKLIRRASSFKNIKEALEAIRSFTDEHRRKSVIAKSYSSSPIEPGVAVAGMILEEAFPPCMKNILERARKGEHLSHHERFAIATFMLSIGADVDAVVDVFRSMPDFNEKITRYQVEHLAGLRGSMKKYKTYSCETMRSLGLCSWECNVRSPIQAYYRVLKKFLKQDSGKERE